MAACRNTESRQEKVSASPACTLTGTLPTEKIAGTTEPVLLWFSHDALSHDALSPAATLFGATREAKYMRICCH